jgi:hypothetical protein
MAVDTIQNDLVVLGAFSSKSITLPPGAVTDTSVAGGANISAAKLQHQYEITYAQQAGLPVSTTTAVSDQMVIQVIRGATAMPLDFKAGVVVANVGAATITIDLWRNGVTILTAPITLTNAQVAYQLVSAAGFAATNLVMGDVLEVKVVAAAGGGTLGKGLFAALNLRGDAQ